MSTRTEKIASSLQHEIAPLVLKYFDKNQFGLVTITKINVLSDLSEARISVVVPKNGVTFFKEIKKKAWKITRDISSRISLKYTPRLVFVPAENDDEVQRVLSILDNI